MSEQAAPARSAHVVREVARAHTPGDGAVPPVWAMAAEVARRRALGDDGEAQAATQLANKTRTRVTSCKKHRAGAAAPYPAAS